MTIPSLRDVVTVRRLRRLFHYLGSGQYRIAAKRVWRVLTRDDLPEISLTRIAADAELPAAGFPDPGATPRVSIVIPVYNHWAATRACLRAILHSAPAVSYEVIVADDASTDDTVRAADVIRNLRLIRHPANLGFLQNCNAAAAQARGEYLVLLNNDTEVQPGWLDALVGLADRDSRIAIVGPMLLYPDGRLQEAGGIVWSDGSGWNYGRGERANQPQFGYVKEVDYVSGACLLIRRAFWQQAGGFDARFVPAYYEDTDLAFAARAAGAKVVYQPLARVIHDEGTTHGRDLSAGIKAHQEVNRVRFREKWRAVLDREHASGPASLFRARDRSLARKTLLFVDHHVPFRDRDAGSRSTFQYLSLLAELDYSVKFLGDNFTAHEPYTTELQQLGIEVLYGGALESGWTRWLAAHGRQIDYAWLSRPDIARDYLGALRRHTRARIAYCGHDLHFLREQRGHAIDPTPARLRAARAWEHTELKVLREVDRAYFFSEVEVAEVRRRVPDAHVRAIPLFLYDAPAATTAGFVERRDLLFVANFRHPPNVDGILWFVTEVLPRIRGELPAARLRIVGADPPPAIAQLADAGVVVLGHLSEDALRNEYAMARVVVAPLRYGAGIKGKVVEAMRNGVPVVTTTFGAEGIGGHSEGLAVAEGSADFADAVIRLYRDESAWRDRVGRLAEVLRIRFSKETARRILSEDLPP